VPLFPQDKLFLIAGPCVLESDDLNLRVADYLAKVAPLIPGGVIFKASFDKANRSNPGAARGPGIDAGLKTLARIGASSGLPVLTDVHLPEHCAAAAQAVDVLQIPAFLCRQTDLLLEAGRTGRIVNIKKGQFVAPRDFRHAAEKVASVGNAKILLTERGSSFGYNNLVVDMRGLEIMREFGWPVVFDATHSVQLPSGAGNASGGQPQFIEPLARAAVAVGVDGIFVEVHDRPDQALSDGPNALRLDQLAGFCKRLRALDGLIKAPNFLHG